jgi:hypothetical protein
VRFCGVKQNRSPLSAVWETVLSVVLAFINILEPYVIACTLILLVPQKAKKSIPIVQKR